MYDSALVLHLWEVFPDSFSTVKTCKTYETINGRFGTEEIETGADVCTLSAAILDTAKAISRSGADIPAAIRFIDEFRPAKVQRQEIASFLRAMKGA